MSFVNLGSVGPSFVMQHLWNKCRRIGAYLVPDVACASVWACVQVPCCGDLHVLLDSISASIQKQQMAARIERDRIWRERMVDSWEHGGAKVYRWCKGEENERADMITRPDGSLTCDAAEMDDLVREAWLPIFQMYKHNEMPAWNAFQTQFGEFFAPRHDMHLDPLDGQKLRATLMRMRSASAPGCDGWRVDELKKLPLPILDRLADLLNIIEETGVWPAALCEGIVSLITKGEGTTWRFFGLGRL